jgi:hypothetical protein
MRLVRSWPADPPGEHARCVDALERVLTPPFDYAPLAGLEADVIHLDWDIAADPALLARFAGRAAEDPDRVLVGPYLTWPGSRHGSDPSPRDLPGPVWTAKVYEDRTETAMRYVTETDVFADLWGFGLVYLPHMWLVAFLLDQGGKMGDMEFSGWYYRQAGPARLAWDCVPFHLNFPAPVL